MPSKEELQGILNDEEIFNNFAKDIFDAFDKEGSGELEQNELRDAMNELADTICTGHLSDEKFIEELKKLDKDGNSKINFDEFKPVAAKFLQDFIAVLE